MEKELEQMLQTVCSKGIKEASSEEIYAALLQWSKEKMNGMKHNEGDRKLYYISAEFLVGKLLSNNLINLGVFEEVREVLKKHGHDLTEIEEVELEPSLGNGGLGLWQHVPGFHRNTRTQWRRCGTELSRRIIPSEIF